MSEAQGMRAVRIELATSELEGGCYRAWADPGQVLTVLALGSPHDVFERTVEPQLRELGPFAPESTEDPAAPSGAPPLVGQLVGCVHEIHTRLYRENHAHAREPRWVELTCALAEEDRIYFLKGAPAYICLLRDGQAHPAGRVAGGEAEGGGTRLGRVEELQVELTSLAVQPGDTVVLLASDPDLPPDLQAIRNLFQRTTDLKRACDGLVNLLGMQSQGACAVAFRFVSVGATPHQEVPRVNPLEELAAEFEGTEFVMAGLPPIDGPPEARPEGISSIEYSADELVRGAAGDDLAAAPTATWAPQELHEQVQAPRPRTWRRYWPAFLSVVFVALVLFVALPRPRTGTSLWGGLTPGNGGGAIGTVEVESEPPAEGVLLNGERVAEGTPARIDSVPAGRQRIGLDFGPSGVWETEVRVQAGGEVRVAPRLVGSIEVLAEDPVSGGQVWVQGRSKRQVPAVLDSLPVGWTRVFYEDTSVPLWDRLVLVKADRTTRIVVPNRKRTGAGLVKVEALLYQEKEGLVESSGDSVWVDGTAEGRTPLEVSLPPGLHSVRVGSAATGYASEVMELKAGSLRHVQAQLGRDQGVQISHVSPGRVRVNGPVLLTMTVSGGTRHSALRPTLHVPELAPGLREIPMAPVSGDEQAYVAMLPAESLPVGRELSYYFTVVGPDGGLLSSDLYRVRAQGDRPRRATPTPPPAPEEAGETSPDAPSEP